jgi:hypothetical protein
MENDNDNEKLLLGLQNLTKYLTNNPQVLVPETIYPHDYGVTCYLGKNTYNVDNSGTMTEDEKAEALKAWIARIAQSLVGTRVKIEKQYQGTSFTLKVTGDKFEIRYQTERIAVCKRVVTDVEVIPAHTRPAEFVPEERIEKVQWVCDDGSIMDK